MYQIKTIRDQLRALYDWGLYTDKEMAKHVDDGVLTKDDYKYVTGKTYDKVMGNE